MNRLRTIALALTLALPGSLLGTGPALALDLLDVPLGRDELPAPAGDGQATGDDALAALRTIDDLMGFDTGAGNLASRVGVFLLRAVRRDMRQPAFREWAGEGMRPATAWPLSQLLAAELDCAMLGRDIARARGVVDELEKYRQDGAYAPEMVSRSGRRQQRYFDDNAWIGLDLVQLHAQTGDARCLQMARDLVPFLESGFLPEGGILWREDDPNPTLNTCANAPTMQFFLALFATTGDERYMKDARHLETTLNESMRDGDGLYVDLVHADDRNQADRTFYSYNQGAALGANLQLAKLATKGADRARHLALATSTADAVMRRCQTDPDWLWKQSQAFNAVLFRNLLKLDLVAPDPRYRAALTAHLDRARAEARRVDNGAYELGGIGRYDGGKAGGLRLIDQAGMAQMLALEALSPDQLSLVL